MSLFRRKADLDPFVQTVVNADQSGLNAYGSRGSIAVPASGSFWRRLFAFSGPAYLISVGYMDPGNWATDIEGGSKFHYQLLWVILASNIIGIILQVLSTRLGVVTGKDLPQMCRERFSKPVAIMLWMLAEVAIAACDLAEVLGSAIALNLLFHIPLMPAVLITALDVLLLLALHQRGVRMLEAVIITLISTVAVCYLVEIILAKPDWIGIAHGLTTPKLTNDSLFIVLGILGATVMPHNLYLHSALVKSRSSGRSFKEIRSALRFNLFDTFAALNIAFLVNAAILVMAAAVFFEHHRVVTEIQEAYDTLTPLLGTHIASLAFGIALLASGQASTITGTLAGQVVMEGFLHLKIKLWLRRIITRGLAIAPAVIVIALNTSGGVQSQNHAIYQLLILSQVVLSVQLSFATVPLVMFTSDKRIMGQFANPVWLKLMAWTIVILIAGLNGYLLISQFA
jgi:manganese transport protein